MTLFAACHRRGRPADAPPPAVRGPRVTSDPSGLELRLDGHPLGRRTPALIETWDPLVSHEIELDAPGRIPFRRLVPAGDPPPLVEADLPPAAELDVATAPSGAVVTLAERSVGVTPLRLPITAGKLHDVGLTLDGYVPERRELVADVGGSKRWYVALRPAGTAYIDSDPEGARVEIDGHPVGSTPLSVPLAADESHRAVISLAGLTPCREGFRVAWRKTAELRCNLQDGVGRRLRSQLSSTRAELAADRVALERLEGPGAGGDYLQAVARDRRRNRLEDEIDRLKDEIDRKQGEIDTHRTELEEKFEKPPAAGE